MQRALNILLVGLCVVVGLTSSQDCNQTIPNGSYQPATGNVTDTATVNCDPGFQPNATDPTVKCLKDTVTNETYWDNTVACVDINECDANPCKNGATCSNLVNAYNCTCASGWQGTNCAEDVCSSNPCKNGGTCNNLGSDYNCTCPMGWNGTNCETAYDVCDLCQNGNCTNTPVYNCTCHAGWHGDNCDQDECQPNPCKNGGTCKFNNPGYTCTCTSGYGGTNCQTATDTGECQSDKDCNDGKTCTVTDGKGQCNGGRIIRIGSILIISVSFMIMWLTESMSA